MSLIDPDATHVAEFPEGNKLRVVENTTSSDFICLLGYIVQVGYLDANNGSTTSQPDRGGHVFVEDTRNLNSTSPTRRRSWWDHVTPALKDLINAVTDAFLADPCPYKINLGVGAYRDDEGKPVVLQWVREAEGKIGATNFLESTSTAISSKLVEESAKLIYREDLDVIKERRFAGIPALSGTGACRIFAEFQKRFYPDSTIYFPDPTWSK
ncbi:aspartate aminotransferase, mitochondrial-like [Gossypium hirsutum]|uniref:Aspartate aminotransferase, mitochondrial-like n=1 Tax=Gossypium hirsutum TaxID=3635 RepID=A0ABM3ASP2_GOSHI|nr:aspartate aminotransferase, mitochondrial-like [Gossypium hirsutum]